MENKKHYHFRKVWVVMPTHNFNNLKEFTQDICFIATGYEEVSDLSAIVLNSLKDFDPNQDALVCVGKVNTVFVTGRIVQQIAGDRPVWIGVYNKEDGDLGNYQWVQL